ncbi:MAG TPA: uroporphyrinogen decarboxylase family protein [Phycisphaerae bacterium]|nr:uroporphyrinogen decarboxylase family protein [Phycisphaerae bacterium]
MAGGFFAEVVRMDSRQRFQQTMRHQSPDRPPIDIGATTLTSMSSGCQAALRELLGFVGEIVPTNSGLDERILQWAGTDFRAVGQIVDLPSRHTRRLSPTKHVDCWGVQREVVGQYSEITRCPLAGASVDDLDAFDWPEPRIDERLLEQWQDQARRLKEQGTYVVIAEHPVYGILELGCWMCGYEDFLVRTAGEPDFVRAFFDKVFAIQMQVIEQYYTALGPYIDLTTSGDDFGAQTGPLISPDAFQSLIAPYFAARIARTKQLADCWFWHHSCGSIFDLLDQILDCGVDILNPVQTSAARMDPGALKSRFGDRVVFWGGLDVQQFLRTAAPEQVRRHVAELIDVLGRDGGYVIAAGHNMQDDVPPANIVAWVETVRGMAPRRDAV